MSVRGRGCSKMPCESCAVQFSVFRRKRACSECERYYCAGCLRRGGGTMCAPCRALSTRPLQRPAIAHLKVRDLQCFLQRQNVSTRGCVEKEELVSLCVAHVNSAAYRRRAPRAPFPSLKGITTNINDFLNSAFDLRPPPPPQPRPPHARHAQPQPRPFPGQPTQNNIGGYNNASNAHAGRRERFNPTPGGEERITVPVPEPERAAAGGARVDTADCFEVEDLDDMGWELVRRPADPLPNDSDVLIVPNEWIPTTPVRASSSLELRSPARSSSPGAAAERASLQDEPASLQDQPASLQDEPASLQDQPASLQDEPASLQDRPARARSPTPPPPAPYTDGSDSDTNINPSQTVTLEDLKDLSDLDSLTVRQIKELLVRNRVEFRGCVERAELHARAQQLWREHARYRGQLEQLPLEECCKICMAAPLECVLLECGHIAACTRCARRLAECPICRQYVVRAVRFFRS